MKRFLTAASAALALAALAGQALAADAVGTVTVNGTVASKCTVVTGGTSGGTSFSSSFTAPGDLADSVGHLAFSGSFTTVGDGDFQINCNKANPTITLSATSMTTAGSAPTGYANSVTYKAYADIKTINASNTTGTVTRSTTSGGSANGPTALGSGLYLQNVANNVVIRADTFAVGTGNASDILVAGSYQGVITLTITPA